MTTTSERIPRAAAVLVAAIALYGCGLALDGAGGDVSPPPPLASGSVHEEDASAPRPSSKDAGTERPGAGEAGDPPPVTGLDAGFDADVDSGADAGGDLDSGDDAGDGKGHGNGNGEGKQ